jgi:ferritin
VEKWRLMKKVRLHLNFLQWFVKEQIEEENPKSFTDKIKIVGGESHADLTY